MSAIHRATEAAARSLARLGAVGVNVHHGNQSWLAYGRPTDDELRIEDADGVLVAHAVRAWTFHRAELTRDNELIIPDRHTRLVELDRHGYSHAWRIAFPGTTHAWQWWDAGRTALTLFCTGAQ